MKRVFPVLLALVIGFSSIAFAVDKKVEVKVKINKLTPSQAEQVKQKVDEIFKGSCKTEVIITDLPPKADNWKYNDMENLIPKEGKIIPVGDRGGHPERKSEAKSKHSDVKTSSKSNDKQCHHDGNHNHKDGQHKGDNHKDGHHKDGKGCGNKGDHHGDKHGDHHGGHHGDHHGDNGKGCGNKGDRGDHGKGSGNGGPGGHGGHGGHKR